MTYSDWRQLHHHFIKLGGDIQNLEARIGSRGRGLFPLDPVLPSGIFCPKQLFLYTKHIQFHDSGWLSIDNSANLSSGVASFLTYYYNSWSWLGGGRAEALTFLEGLSLLPIQYRAKLIELRLLPSNLLMPSIDELSLFKRFIYTRTASYDSSQILAPVWDLVNHSSFAQPFRNTLAGICTPPRGEEIEHLHRYSDFKSPLGMWAHYGFSCNTPAAYSCPVIITSAHTPITLHCHGEHYSKPTNNTPNVTTDGNIVSIRTLNVGSISANLPLTQLRLLLQPFGIHDEALCDFHRQLSNFNIAIRKDLLDTTNNISSPCIHALQRGLSLEMRLIVNSQII